jgi:hypothetical protein
LVSSPADRALTETVEGVAHSTLDETHFFIAELFEFAFAAVPAAPRRRAATGIAFAA